MMTGFVDLSIDQLFNTRRISADRTDLADVMIVYSINKDKDGGLPATYHERTARVFYEDGIYDDEDSKYRLKVCLQNEAGAGGIEIECIRPLTDKDFEDAGLFDDK